MSLPAGLSFSRMSDAQMAPPARDRKVGDLQASAEPKRWEDRTMLELEGRNGKCAKKQKRGERKGTVP